jgi:hypothetical protein
MATTSYGTPMTMGMTAGMGSQPMTTTGLQAGVVRNMNLPLSRATPIQVTETTPNLEEIQNFPVAGRGLDGTHFHQDPVSGQMYVMTDEFHQRIPEILRNRMVSNQTITTLPSLDATITSNIEETTNKNEFIESFAQTTSNIPQLSVLNELFSSSNISDFTPFTQQVTEVSQKSFTPFIIQENESVTVGPIRYLNQDNLSVNNLINIINNTNNFSSEQIIEPPSTDTKPITKIIQPSYSTFSNMSSTYSIPINIFYNTNNFISY